jgi:hypothetical protein
VDIAGGTGNIEFSNEAAIAFTAGSSIVVDTITFTNGFKTPDSSGNVTLGGEVTIPKGEDIVFGNGGASKLTLAAGSEISAGDAKILSTTARLVMTGAATTVLTATEGTGGKPNELVVSKGGVTFGGDVAVEGKLAIAEDGELDVDADGKFDVKENATVTVIGEGEDGGTFKLADGSSGTLNGTVEVGSGGKLYDLTKADDASGGSLWGGEANGSFVLKPGAEAYLNLLVEEETYAEVCIVGGSGNTEAQVVLKTGTITLIKTGYEIAGEAVLQENFSIWSDQTLTINSGAKLTGKQDDIELTVNGTITFETPVSTKNFYKESETSIITENPIPAGIYKWAANAGGVSTAGWKAQPST